MAASMPTAWTLRLEEGGGAQIFTELGLPRDDQGEDSLGVFFEALTAAKAGKLWESVSPDIAASVRSLKNGPLQPGETSKAIEALTGCALAIKTYLSKCKHRVPSLLAAVTGLSTLLGDYDDESDPCSALKNHVSGICELLFLTGSGGAEQLLPETVTYLLRESLRADAKDSTVKRLVAIKHGFLLLDFSGTSHSTLRDLLLRCFVHPSYIKCAEARKFLSDLLAACDGILCEAACKVIKVQVSSGSSLIATQYGAILFRAWKEHSSKSPALRRKIEECFQDFVHEAIHAEAGRRFKGLRALIKSFHDVKRTDAFNQFLVDMYDPIIWRSLRCANAIARSQAAVVFLDVFPLQRVSSNPEDCDLLLQKQFDQLTSLLRDEDHRVRAIATTGVCHILREYWDMLPAGTVHNILKYIFDTLAFDTSSANVRLAVVMGVQDLLQQPLSHSAMKGLLPLLQNYIHDKSDKVRLAFVKTLEMVKSMEGVKYYEVVPVPHLLARLAEDRNNEEIVATMSTLLLNSYFPSTTTDKFEKVNRCLQFIQDNAVAAQAFYGHIHKQVSIGSVAKLVAMLFSLLLIPQEASNTPQKPSKPSGKRRRGGARQETADADSRPAVSDSPPAISNAVEFLRVLRVTVAILQSIQPALPNNASSLELITKYITEENLSLLVEVVLTQTAHVDYLAASTLQLITVMSGLTGAQQRSAFSLSFLFETIFLPVLPLASSEASHRLLCQSFIRAVIATDQQLELLEEVEHSLSAFRASLRKKPKTPLLTLQAAAVVCQAFVELLCRSITEECNEEVLTKFSALWESLKTLLEAVFSASSSDMSQENLSSVLQLSRSWITFCTFATSSTAISALVPDARTTEDPALYLLHDWLDSVMPSPATCMSLAAPTSAASLTMQVFNTRLLLLADAAVLLPEKTLERAMRVLATLFQACAQGFESAEAARTSHTSMHELLLRSALVAGDRLCKQWPKVLGDHSTATSRPLREAMQAFLTACAGLVSEDDQELLHMHTRCNKVVGGSLSAAHRPAFASEPSSSTTTAAEEAHRKQRNEEEEDENQQEEDDDNEEEEEETFGGKMIGMKALHLQPRQEEALEQENKQPQISKRAASETQAPVKAVSVASAVSRSSKRRAVSNSLLQL